MKSSGFKSIIITLFILGAVGAAGWIVWSYLKHPQESAKRARTRPPAPVEVAAIQRGLIASQRTFSGELEAAAAFVVAPKVSGRVERMLVNIADTVKRGQVVAELDNDEYEQAVMQAQANMEVAQANLAESQSAMEIAEREFKRTQSLLKRGIASDSEFDAVKQDLQAKRAQSKVAAAQLRKAESSLQTAKIQLGYTRVTAGWSGGGDERVVAERYVDEGQTVAAYARLLLIVELNPILGVVFVTEKDYAYLKPGQRITLTTDAYPNDRFTGRIDRIAPVFNQSTRQARIEMTIDNPGQRLKPGMFIRAEVELARVPDAVIIPEQALCRRNDKDGVFLVSDDGKAVIWREVKVGVRQEDRVQVTGEGLSRRVVTLGQQLISDGSPITIPADQNGNAPGPEKENQS